ncbi:unnamed protein product [Paramecium octaurelia]|uniref:Uncharacterized protein n=1 Tax=Paramecium octaurelia TaxID=43137 RepID=A0A8S1VW64_PAROT|nr:unnamed protein product [Paramecium octaurelia]
MNIKQLFELQEQDADKLPLLLQTISHSKNEEHIRKAINIIQQFNQTFNPNQQLSIIDFINEIKKEQDIAIDIKLISTLLHIIDINWMQNCTKLFNLFLTYTVSENSIVQQSAIQGILLIVSLIQGDQLLEYLEIFFLILQDKNQTKINSNLNTILCKDIFIILLKNGRTYKNQEFYSSKLYNYLLSLDISMQSNQLSKINSVFVISTYILMMEDHIQLLDQIINLYAKSQQKDIIKIAIHDALLYLYQNESIITKLFTQKIKNSSNSYHEQIFKTFYNSTMLHIQEYEQIQSQKSSSLIVNFSVKYLEFINTVVFNKYIQQLTSLINVNIQFLITQDYDKNYVQICRPMFKLLKQILQISTHQQCVELNEQLYKWIQQSKKGQELMIKFLSQISVPDLNSINARKEINNNWIISYNILCECIKHYMSEFSPKIWNQIFQTMQRIEMINFSKDEIMKFFINSSEYDDQTLIKIMDGLNQLALQIVEKVQINSNTTDINQTYKQFAIDKIVLIVQVNVFRLEKIWQTVEALLLCLCQSKSQEMRLYSLNSLKSIICQCFNNKYLKIDLFNAMYELINSRFDDVVEYIMNLLYLLIKEQQISDTLYIDLIKVFETLLNEKEEFIHLLLCLNCLSELIFNQLDQLNDQCLMRMASICVYLTKYLSKQYQNEIKHKIICMLWQLQLKSIQHKINNPGLWNMSLKLIKDTMDNQDDLKFAALHIASQLCLNSQNEQFNEIYELFEELMNNCIVQYLRIEFQQISLFSTTPRFNHNNLIETPKFQIQSIKFDKQTVNEQYKQSLEILKLCISLWAEIVIQKEKYDKFYYHIQSFNQAQLVYIKHEIIMALSKILEHTTQQIEISLDILNSLLDNDQIDTQYFIDNDTFHYICQILSRGFGSQQQKSFIISSKLMALVCNENYLFDNSILKSYVSQCLPGYDVSEEDALKWLNFISEQFSSIGVQLRFHKLLEMLCTSYDIIIRQKLTERMVEPTVKFIRSLIIQLNKCQRFLNDNSERLQITFINKIKQLISQIITFLKQDVLRQIVEPILMQNKKIYEWVQYFLSLQYNEEQEMVIVELITTFYINQIITKENISQQTTIINIISLFQNNNNLNNKILETIKPTLLSSIYSNLAQFIEETERKNEEIHNMGLMLDFLYFQEQILRPGILQFIKCEYLDLRLKIVQLLKKFKPQ